MVVEEAEFGECLVERLKRIDGELVEFLLEGAEESLDPAVLPGTAGIRALMTDAEQKERKAEHFGSDDRLVIGPDRLGLAVAFYGLAEFQDQCPGGFTLQRFQPQRGAAGVLENGKYHPGGAVERCFAGEIQAPDEVSGNRPGRGVLDAAPLDCDLVEALADDLIHPGFAYCHPAPLCEAPVEDLLDRPAAAGLVHEGLEANDFLLDPLGLALGVR